MRLIDIEAPCKIEIELDGKKCHATVTANTIDAVPVVRCKDCVHFGGSYWCKWYEHGTDANGYCHHGERKDDE